ncbi:MAG: electron transport complex subunit E [bacterium]|nr:electron transport complex subunit E [bacterium]
MNVLKKLFNGIWTSNPVLILLLGFCPTLAVSTTLKDAIGMGFSALFVLVGSNLVISALRKFTPQKMRIPIFIIVIATFVTIVDLLLYAYFFPLHKSLGVFIPLIVVNCIVFGRAEAFASKNSIIDSLWDGIGMGLGFTLTISVLASIREILGNGTLLGIELFGKSYSPVIVAILPPGAFMTLGLMLAGMNKININMEAKRKAREKAEKEKSKQLKASVANG